MRRPVDSPTLHEFTLSARSFLSSLRMYGFDYKQAYVSEFEGKFKLGICLKLGQSIINNREKLEKYMKDHDVFPFDVSMVTLHKRSD